MKITFEGRSQYDFEDLQAGAIFIFEGYVYMKIKYNSTFVAINLRTGKPLSSIFNTSLVECVEAELIVKAGEI